MIDKNKSAEYFNKRYHSKDELNIYTDRVLTVPNILTLSRLIALPFLLWFLSNIDRFGLAPPMAIGAYMVLTDMFDGALAKALKQISIVGAILDPVVDKLVIDSLAIVLSFNGYIPIWAAVLIFSRDFFILIFGLRIVLDYETLITPAIIGRITPLSWVCTFAVSLLDIPLAGTILLWISVCLTVVSGLIYFVRYRNLLEMKKTKD